MIDAEELATLKAAFAIGFVSWDGDGWYASKDARGEDGHTYEEAEAIMGKARDILARLSESVTNVT